MEKIVKLVPYFIGGLVAGAAAAHLWVRRKKTATTATQ